MIPLKESARSLRVDEEIVGRVHPQRVLRLTLHIKPGGDQLASNVRELVHNRVQDRSHLSRQQYADTHGLKQADLQKVRQFTRQSGLQMVPDRVGRQLSAAPHAHRTVEVRGTARDIDRTFGTELVRVRGQDGVVHHTYQGPLSIPDEFHGVIANVLGLDNRTQASPHSRPIQHLGGSMGTGLPSFTPVELSQIYQFPTGVSGKGQTIAILELGGGYRRRDLRRYFNGLGLQMPDIFSVGIGGARNAPTGHPNGPDSEVMLDIEVAAAVANGARIVVYFAPNTNRGFFRGINAAVHDAVNQPSILSISWGAPEASWSIQDMRSIDEAFQAAAVMGISVFVAAGDNGSTDGVPGRIAHVDFPASSPFATACGGTRLIASGGAYSAETVWNEGESGGTGGGISSVFTPAEAPYQSGTAVGGAIPPSANPGAPPGRGLPDVAGVADPNTGYKVRIDGVDTVYGGTSAVAPLWAGLFALLNESLNSPIGFANPLLYSIAFSAGALRDITQGDNDTTGRLGGHYAAGQYWDPCTGLGSPNGGILLNALR